MDNVRVSSWYRNHYGPRERRHRSDRQLVPHHQRRHHCSRYGVASYGHAPGMLYERRFQTRLSFCRNVHEPAPPRLLSWTHDAGRTFRRQIQRYRVAARLQQETLQRRYSRASHDVGQQLDVRDGLLLRPFVRLIKFDLNINRDRDRDR